ncbi:MAG TPA: ABC transporter permease [Tepidisphaeraceae bacterium]|nr:ABC transporter permease [Tepidisphaeraceae bacterium]
MEQQKLEQPVELWNRRLPRLLSRYGMIVVLAVIGFVLAISTSRFLTVANLLTVARQISVNGILAVGVTFVLLTGGVDLSLGSVVALSGVAAAGVGHPDSPPLFVPIMVGIGTGLICGLVNGAIVTLGRVPSFIVTLGMMVAAHGAALRASGGQPIGNLSIPFQRLAAGNIFEIPNPVLILAMLSIVSYIVLRHMRLGRYIYAIGGSEPAANASGVNVKRVKIIAYAVCGACAGLAGVVLTSRTSSGSPVAGAGYELDAITAAVIGGTRLSGGVGGVGGTILGALLLGTINNGQDLLNVGAYSKDIIKGCIIVCAVLFDRRTQL